MSKHLDVVSGPSGAGVRDVVAAVYARRADVCAVTPVTARKMKPGEQDGVGFWFYDLEGWNALKETGDLLEATELAGNDYGTSRRLVREKLDAGYSVLLQLEIERAAQVRCSMPEAVCIYIEPTEPVLLQRYQAISRCAPEVTARMAVAAEQREKSAFCDVRICSDDLAAATAELEALID